MIHGILHEQLCWQTFFAIEKHDVQSFTTSKLTPPPPLLKISSVTFFVKRTSETNTVGDCITYAIARVTTILGASPHSKKIIEDILQYMQVIVISHGIVL